MSILKSINKISSRHCNINHQNRSRLEYKKSDKICKYHSKLNGETEV